VTDAQTRRAAGTDDAFLRVLDEAIRAIDEAGIDFLMIGGVASAALGRDRGTSDIDVFVHPDSAQPALDALAARGFETEIVDRHWLYKARLGPVDVDVIFRASRDFLLDEEMLRRRRDGEYRGRRLPIAPLEDMIVMKAIAFDEDTPRYWFDAVAMLSHPDVDWDYLTYRARRHGVRRVLSLLLYATSIDLAVPTEPVHELFQMIMGGSDADAAPSDRQEPASSLETTRVDAP
jgi:predicted nucleotidyltransferase